MMSFENIATKYPEMFSFVQQPEHQNFCAPPKSLIETGMENFQETRNKLKWWWLYVLDETYLGMVHVVAACLSIRTLNFFTSSLGKGVSLEEFESIQNNTTTSVCSFFSN